MISFYALAFGGLLLADGRVGDLLGRLRVFRFGITVFALASMAGGFASNGTALVAARVVQGCGAAIAAPGALSLLATTFPAGSARTKALGVYGAMGGLGSVLGLLPGGVLTEYLSWRWVLFIKPPLQPALRCGRRGERGGRPRFGARLPGGRGDRPVAVRNHSASACISCGVRASISARGRNGEGVVASGGGIRGNSMAIKKNSRERQERSVMVMTTPAASVR